jgi:transposase
VELSPDSGQDLARESGESMSLPNGAPLRLIRRIVNEVLAALDSEFSRLYAAEGRPSIAPERLLRALLLQAFYSVRSERQLMEQLHYNLLYRWFVGLGVDDPWVPTVFTKNRDRLLAAKVARKFLAELLAHRDVRALLSSDHFSVDGTQVQAWASMESFVAKDGSSDPASPSRWWRSGGSPFCVRRGEPSNVCVCRQAVSSQVLETRDPPRLRNAIGHPLPNG